MKETRSIVPNCCAKNGYATTKAAVVWVYMLTPNYHFSTVCNCSAVTISVTMIQLQLWHQPMNYEDAVAEIDQYSNDWSS